MMLGLWLAVPVVSVVVLVMHLPVLKMRVLQLLLRWRVLLVLNVLEVGGQLTGAGGWQG